jgi:2-amino-4-hydroxy-6-hydroxymethyldihydropteridine diphosphokinase
MAVTATLPVNAYVGIGANLGDAKGTVLHAIGLLRQLAQTRVTAQSCLYRTAPIDAGGEDYVNAVVKLETGLAAQALLEALQATEQACGRERPYPNAPRTLDLDILLYGAQHIATATLTVPHPRMKQRAFVLVPLVQIDPLVQIPGFGAARLLLAGVSAQRIEEM